jgi:hypothetical protein
MERLHEECPHPADECPKVTVDNPRGIGGKKVARFVTSSDNLQPRRVTVG